MSLTFQAENLLFQNWVLYLHGWLRNSHYAILLVLLRIFSPSMTAALDHSVEELIEVIMSFRIGIETK